MTWEAVEPRFETSCPLQSSMKSRFFRSGGVLVNSPFPETAPDLSEQIRPRAQVRSRDDTDRRIPQAPAGFVACPVVERRHAREVKEPRLLAESAGEMRADVARRDHQVAGFHRGEDSVDVAEEIEPVDARQASALGREAVSLFLGVAILKVQKGDVVAPRKIAEICQRRGLAPLHDEAVR